ncbi:11871_t:CDS:2 [Acaulospora morrowiae]|uniref:lipoyl(octanoyl) transferase n=1 Tax=Acaulospora morrowiae TaxID=94023 RepID=A0A9N9H3I3_9GLOM|nr:11871_t:CDS:2 [Acaulospora morrowiae]
MSVKDILNISTPLILDGGTATELLFSLHKDISTHLWSAALLYEDPKSIIDVHLSYLNAGADIITTCSYQASVQGFIKSGFTPEHSKKLMLSSISLAVEARDQFWHSYLQRNEKTKLTDQRIKPLIALSIGPYGAILTDGSEYTGDYGPGVTSSTILEFHRSRLETFLPKFSEIDLIAFETIPSLQEAETICKLLNDEKYWRTGTPPDHSISSFPPCWISFSCKDESLISHGEELAHCVRLCCEVECVVGIGINCTKPKFVTNLVRIVRKELDALGHSEKFVICYPDGGCIWDPVRKIWDLDTRLSSDEFGILTRTWVKQSNNKIIMGGCCQITPEMRLMARRAYSGISLPVLPYIYLSQVPYAKALNLQKVLVQRRLDKNDSSLPNLLLLLQHPPTYTTGRRDRNKNIEAEEARLKKLGAEYFKTLRGGQTTFHGPGQLVGYPIIDLRDFKLSVRNYVNAIERVIIQTCATYKIAARSTKNVGIWVENEKICAIGIQVQRYITSHGFALNCNNDLSWFDHIIPCGLEDKKVTSLTKEVNKRGQSEDINVEQVIPILCQHLDNIFGCSLIPFEDIGDESIKRLKELIDDLLE